MKRVTLAALVVAACADLTTPRPVTTTTVVISRAAAVQADSAHVQMRRVSGIVVDESGAAFGTKDSVTLRFAFVLLADSERFEVVLALLQAGNQVYADTIPFLVRRDGSLLASIRVREWVQDQATTLPPLRARARYVYSRALGGIVLAGGVGPGGPLNDAWLFDGRLWQPLPSMPFPRRDHAMAETARGVVVFGGALPTNAIDAFRAYEFDGATWHVVVAPSTRDSTVGAYDRGRRQTVFFGQRSATAPPTTFVGFEPRQLPGPSARTGHAMVYDSVRQAVLLIGGRSREGVDLSDVWMWDGSAWTEVQTRGEFPARSDHFAMYDPARGVVVVVGGRTGGTLRNDVWELHRDTWRPVATPVGLTPRAGGGFEFLESADMGVLTGGQEAGGLVADLWLYR